jgi:hypothetical protein
MSIKASHPTYAVMVTMAIKFIKSFSKGALYLSIKAYVEANNKVGKASHAELRAALTKLVSSGVVTQDGSRFMLSKAVCEAAYGKKAASKKKKVSTKTKKKSTKTKASTKKVKDDSEPASGTATDGAAPACHQSEMARLHTAESKAYNAQHAGNKKELAGMEVDTADIKRTCPVCCTPREGDFEKCECGVLLGCSSCMASKLKACQSCERGGCGICMEASSCGGCRCCEGDGVYCEECLDHDLLACNNRY